MRRVISVLSVLILSLTLLFTSSAVAEEETEWQSPQGLAQCVKVFQSGSGPSFFKWCYHPNATLGYLEAGSTTPQHLWGDRWGLCSAYNTVVHGTAFGNPGGYGQSGLRTPTFPAPNAVLVRTTDNRFEIRQDFTQTPAEKSILIKVTIKNLTSKAIDGVTFSRKVDFDLNNSPAGDLWVSSYASVLTVESQAITLTGITWGTPRDSQVETLSTEPCRGTKLATPIVGDYAGRVNYRINRILPGEAKSVVYRITQL